MVFYILSSWIKFINSTNNNLYCTSNIKSSKQAKDLKWEIGASNHEPVIIQVDGAWKNWNKRKKGERGAATGFSTKRVGHIINGSQRISSSSAIQAEARALLNAMEEVLNFSNYGIFLSDSQELVKGLINPNEADVQIKDLFRDLRQLAFFLFLFLLYKGSKKRGL